MIQYSIVIEQPTNEPVTLQQAKTHLEYTGTLKDSYIDLLITAGRRLAEAYCGLSLVTQIRRVELDCFPSGFGFILLPYGPVQSIESFTYANEDGTTTTLVEDTDFKVDYHSRMTRVYAIGSDGQRTCWPSDVRNILSPIRVDYQSGFDDVSGEATPSEAKVAIMEYCADMFENRGDDQGGKIGDALPWRCMMILDAIKVNWNANTN